MSTASIDYDTLVQGALRGVVRAVLEDVAANGLPGHHHFYIAFRTTHPDVDIPDHLRKRYPEEITIVLQHQFWDLKVADERFEVSLSFNGKPERLVVPLEAMTGFMDPSVQFGLQLQPDGRSFAQDVQENTMARMIEPKSDNQAPEHDINIQNGSHPSGDDNVVTLDRFRKDAKTP